MCAATTKTYVMHTPTALHYTRIFKEIVRLELVGRSIQKTDLDCVFRNPSLLPLERTFVIQNVI